MTSPDKRN